MSRICFANLGGDSFSRGGFAKMRVYFQKRDLPKGDIREPSHPPYGYAHGNSIARASLPYWQKTSINLARKYTMRATCYIIRTNNVVNNMWSILAILRFYYSAYRQYCTVAKLYLPLCSANTLVVYSHTRCNTVVYWLSRRPLGGVN